MDRPASFSVAPGAIVRCQGRAYRVTRPVCADSVLADELDTGIPERLLIAALEPPGPQKDVPAIPDLEVIPPDKRHEAERRLAAIGPLIHRSDRLRAEVEAAAKTAGVHPATMYEWIRLYERSGHLTSLLSNKGGRRKSTRMLSADVEALVNSAIEQEYLTKQQKLPAAVIQAVENACDAAKLPRPHPNTVRRRIAELDKRKTLRRRGDRDGAQKLESIKGSFPKTTRPLEVVQIDHTLGDVVLVDGDERLPYKRPWITLAIDLHTRMVVGIYVSFEAPSAASVGMVVAQVMLRKEAVLAALDVKGPWPVWGRVAKIHTDNGKEFRSGTLRNACEQYSVGLEYRPPATPRFGGHIERLMGTTARAIRNLPGATFSSPAERKHYDSHKEAAMTIDEFEAWLTEWLVTYYNNLKPHHALCRTPLEAWNAAILGDGKRPGIGHFEPLADHARVRIDFLPAFQRLVDRGQIRIDNVVYAAPQLGRYNDSKQKFVVRRDPRKISPVYFWDPHLREHVPVHYANVAQRVVSLWELRGAKGELRATGRRNVSPAELAEFTDRQAKRVEGAVASTKAARRARQRRADTKRAEAQTPADPHNLLEPPPALAPELAPAEEDAWPAPTRRTRVVDVL